MATARIETATTISRKVIAFLLPTNINNPSKLRF
jgi:hypothetical protein